MGNKLGMYTTPLILTKNVYFVPNPIARYHIHTNIRTVTLRR